MEIVELGRGKTRAIVIPEAGGRLHQLSIRDGNRWLPLLRSPASLRALQNDPLGWGSYAMAPWPGRIDGGRFLWRGRLHEVPVNSGGHSLHGRGVYLPWTLETRTAAACRLSVDFDGGWPFAGRAVQEFAVLDDGVSQRIEVQAAQGSRFPAGAGWHPWFRRDVRRGEDVRVLIDADRAYETAEMIPTGWTAPATGERDLRGYPALSGRRLDVCYQHTRAALRVRWGDIELTMRSSRNVTHAVVFTPKQGFCVEPQTCAPDAFNLAAQGVDGTGMAVVDARHPLSATTTWRWTIGAISR
jgi:aldose 1-epimerase